MGPGTGSASEDVREPCDDVEQDDGSDDDGDEPQSAAGIELAYPKILL
jgi:hypothetical protein